MNECIFTYCSKKYIKLELEVKLSNIFMTIFKRGFFFLLEFWVEVCWVLVFQKLFVKDSAEKFCWVWIDFKKNFQVLVSFVIDSWQSACQFL